MSVDPYYEPWEGSLFRTKPFEDVRLLLVGESSYEPAGSFSKSDDLLMDTRKVADGNFLPKHSGFWRFIQRSVLREFNDLDRVSQNEFWNRVALVNLVQRPMPSKNSRPNYADYACGASALVSYVRRLRPEAVIIYSKEAWNSVQQAFSLVGNAERLAEDAAISAPGLSPSNLCWSSNFLGASSPLFLLARHPSACPKMTGVSWNKLIEPLIVLARHNKIIHAACEDVHA